MDFIENDIELLHLMMADSAVAPAEYQPTNYWSNYQKLLLPELERTGLVDFRRRKDSVLSSFGATDLLPISAYTNHLPIWGIKSKTWLLIRHLSKIQGINSFFRKVSAAYIGVSVEDLYHLCYEFARMYGLKNGAVPLENLDASPIGNPEDLFSIQGRNYTFSVLNYYLQYAYCCKFIDFSKIQSLMELGGGSGKQIEVIRKLHPDIECYLFDIPPQAYVCQQYLSAVFPGEVVSYRVTRVMEKIEAGNAGKIYQFSPEKIATLKNLNYDLFWNSGSFQEMEPPIVMNYLNHVDKQANRGVYLHEAMEGQSVAAKPGAHGVLVPTTMEHYHTGLAGFRLINQERSVSVPNMNTSSSFTFWEKK